MVSVYDAPPQPGDEWRRWDEARQRVRYQLENGPQVRFISTQLALLIIIVALGAVQITARIGAAATPQVLAQYIALLTAVTFAGRGYIQAKRTGRLLPQIPAPRHQWPLAPLLPTERRHLNRQLRGKEPLTETTKPLIRDLIHNAQRNNRAIYPSLVGLFLFLLSDTLFLGWPWPLLVIGLTIFMLIITRIERHRWRKTLALIGGGPKHH